MRCRGFMILNTQLDCRPDIQSPREQEPSLPQAFAPSSTTREAATNSVCQERSCNRQIQSRALIGSALPASVSGTWRHANHVPGGHLPMLRGIGSLPNAATHSGAVCTRVTPPTFLLP